MFYRVACRSLELLHIREAPPYRRPATEPNLRAYSASGRCQIYRSTGGRRPMLLPRIRAQWGSRPAQTLTLLIRCKTMRLAPNRGLNARRINLLHTSFAPSRNRLGTSPDCPPWIITSTARRLESDQRASISLATLLSLPPSVPERPKSI